MTSTPSSLDECGHPFSAHGLPGVEHLISSNTDIKRYRSAVAPSFVRIASHPPGTGGLVGHMREMGTTRSDDLCVG